MITPIVLFSLAGLTFIILSFILNRNQGTLNRDSANRVLIGLLRVFGVAILIAGNTYAILSQKGWTAENILIFKVLCLILICLSMVLIGVRFFTISSGLARISSTLWIVMWFGIGFYSYQMISAGEEGWNEQKRQTILNKVTPYDRLCYLEQIMIMYPDPADYNKNAVKDEEKIKKTMEKNCKVCDLGEAESVDGLPDDF